MLAGAGDWGHWTALGLLLAGAGAWLIMRPPADFRAGGWPGDLSVDPEPQYRWLAVQGHH